MYRILTASKDTYITNKIINNKFRATDANVGKASTLDLFKLYGESTSGSAGADIEISRAFVKFNLNPLRQITGSFLDINSKNFKVLLRLSDVYGGQTTPSNFKLIVFPLSRSFDEGIGRDIVNFSDLDSCNFITASVSSGTPSLWFVSGANKQGFLGSSDIDIISSGTLSGSSDTQNMNLWVAQTFKSGDENLLVDVTTIVSATLASLIPDYGFRISYSGSFETNQKTYFVKRFASRESSDYVKKPSLIIKYDDSLQDNHRSFFFDLSGSLFLNNSARGIRRNLISGAAGTELTGESCLHLRLVSGSTSEGTLFKKTITGSQHKIGKNFITGVYSASFAVSEFENSTLFSEVRKATSASFKTIWSPTDESFAFLTSSLVINRTTRTSFDNDPKRLLVRVTNMKPVYRTSDRVRFRVFVEDIDRSVIFKKLPMETISIIFTKMYYRIRDSISKEVIIPFEKSLNSTLCSTDSDGMYFDFYMDSLAPGRLYTIEFLINDNDENLLFVDAATKFRLER
jgi:hypothetical protein